jgi:hypothetical protein
VGLLLNAFMRRVLCHESVICEHILAVLEHSGSRWSTPVAAAAAGIKWHCDTPVAHVAIIVKRYGSSIVAQRMLDAAADHVLGIADRLQSGNCYCMLHSEEPALTELVTELGACLPARLWDALCDARIPALLCNTKNGNSCIRFLRALLLCPDQQQRRKLQAAAMGFALDVVQRLDSIGTLELPTAAEVSGATVALMECGSDDRKVVAQDAGRTVLKALAQLSSGRSAWEQQARLGKALVQLAGAAASSWGRPLRQCQCQFQTTTMMMTGDE